MTTSALTTTAARPADLLAVIPIELLRRNRRLALAGFAIIALMAPTWAALLIDPRTLNGISVWVKPLKFEASVGLYLLTLAWFFGELPERVRAGAWVRGLATLAVTAGTFEIAYISIPTGRGLASHFNVGDPFHASLYGLMCLAAVPRTAVIAALAGLLIRHRPRYRPAGCWLAVLAGVLLRLVLCAG